MNLTLKDVAPESYSKAVEDHSNAEYEFYGCEGEMTIYAIGHYTVEELEFKLRLLKEAVALRADTQISLSFRKESTKQLKPIEQSGWRLMTESGEPVVMGQSARTFRGEKCTIKGGTPPLHAGSTGHVESSLGQFYPGVFNMKWAQQ